MKVFIQQLDEILWLRDNVLQRLESQRRSAVALAAIKELAAARATQASSQSDLGDRHPQVGDAGQADVDWDGGQDGDYESAPWLHHQDQDEQMGEGGSVGGGSDRYAGSDRYSGGSPSEGGEMEAEAEMNEQEALDDNGASQQVHHSGQWPLPLPLSLPI